MIFMCFMIVLNKPLLNGYSSREDPMTNVYPGLLKQNWTFRLSKGTGLSMEKIPHHVNLSMAQEIYGDRVSVGCSEKFFILRKFFILKNSLLHVICKLFSFWLVFWLKSL